MEEENIKKNNKKKTTLCILLIIILVVLILLGGYFIYNKIKDNNDEINTEEVMKKEEEMLDKPKIVNIINKELHYLIGIQDLKDLNDDDLSYIAMYLYNDGDMSQEGDINIAALEAKINKSSLAKMKYKYKPIKDIGPNGLRRNEEVENLYNLESDTYTKTDVAHGETYLENYMIDSELKNENDTFIFNCKYVFAAFTDEPEDVKLYYTANDYLNNKSFKTIEYSENIENDITKYIKDNQKEIKKNSNNYTYKFTKSNNRYYLTDYHVN